MKNNILTLKNLHIRPLMNNKKALKLISLVTPKLRKDCADIFKKKPIPLYIVADALKCGIIIDKRLLEHIKASRDPHKPNPAPVQAHIKVLKAKLKDLLDAYKRGDFEK